MERARWKLTPGMVLRRGHYGYFFCYWLYGLIADFRLAGRPLNGTVLSSKCGAFPVQSITYPYLRALIPHLDFGDDEVFVDVGCAWGRLLGYLRAHTGIRRLVGVEVHEEVAAFARRVFSRDPNTTILAGDILENLPLEGTVFYLFNPFDRDTLCRFLDAIEDRIRHPVKLLYLHPTCKDVIDARPERWRLVQQTEIAPAHLGALTLCRYEYRP